MARLALLSADDLLQMDLPDLVRAWDDLPPIYQESLACHPKAPPYLLWYAVKLGPKWINRHAFPEGPIPKELIWDLFLSQALELEGVDPRLAAHPSVGPDVLFVLADLGDEDVRFKVAGHPNATEAVLMRLSDDPAHPVREKAAKRLRAEKTLRRFFRNILPDGEGQDCSRRQRCPIPKVEGRGKSCKHEFQQ